MAAQRHLDTLHDLLRTKVRAAEKPDSHRTTASVDSQSVDTTSGGEQRGRDNAKNVDGRKRHLVVDSMGLLLAVPVMAASADDGAAAELFGRLDGQPVGKVLTKEREKTVRSSEELVKLAMIHLMLNRLKPKHVDAEFQYHTAA